MLQHLRRRQTFCRIHPHEVLYEVLGAVGYRPPHRAGEVYGGCTEHIKVALERKFRPKHHIKHHAQAPEVYWEPIGNSILCQKTSCGLMVRTSARDDLRGKVRRSPCERLRSSSSIADSSCQTKVRNFQDHSGASLCQKNVFGLQVPMREFPSVQVVESLDDHPEEGSTQTLRHPPSAEVLRDKVEEVTPRTHFEHEEETVPACEVFQQPHTVLVVHLPQRLDLCVWGQPAILRKPPRFKFAPFDNLHSHPETVLPT
mmetsp:Transcript_45874/g.90367  ORF Transcript_45874/g.90367 Transcript_45874/m.90367 type:complete len:257 (+) Transcript_45874:73-843(+)